MSYPPSWQSPGQVTDNFWNYQDPYQQPFQLQPTNYVPAIQQVQNLNYQTRNWNQSQLQFIPTNYYYYNNTQNLYWQGAYPNTVQWNPYAGYQDFSYQQSQSQQQQGAAYFGNNYNEQYPMPLPPVQINNPAHSAIPNPQNSETPLSNNNYNHYQQETSEELQSHQPIQDKDLSTDLFNEKIDKSSRPQTTEQNYPQPITSPKQLPVKMYECNTCNQKFSQSYLRRHIWTHANEKNYQGVQINHSSNQPFKVHMRADNNNQAQPSILNPQNKEASQSNINYNQQVLRIPEDFTNKQIPSVIIQNAPSPDTTHQPPVQPKSKLHLEIHANENSNKCTICSKTFKEVSVLIRHMKIHAKGKSFKCEVCAKCFTFQSYLKKHMKIHAKGKSFKCEVCAKCFTVRAYLKEHMSTHAKEMPYMCVLCNRRFATAKIRRVHMLTHTEERPYHCKECEKCFKTTSALKLHIRTHTREKPYNCNICSKSFAFASGRSKHKKRCHKEKNIKT